MKSVRNQRPTSRGWVKVHRSLDEWEHFTHPYALQLLVWILLNVNEHGTIALNYPRLMAALGKSRNNIKASVKMLVDDGKIEISDGQIVVTNFSDCRATKSIATQVSPHDNDVSPHDKQVSPHDNDVSPHDTPPPYYIKQESNKNINKSSERDARVDDEAVVEELFDHGDLMDRFCHDNGVAVWQAREWAQAIVAEWRLTGATHRDAGDAKRHLINVLRIRARQYRELQTKQNCQPYATTQRNTTRDQLAAGYAAVIARLAAADGGGM